jgi:hypothetical protein
MKTKQEVFEDLLINSVQDEYEELWRKCFAQAADHDLAEERAHIRRELLDAFREGERVFSFQSGDEQVVRLDVLLEALDRICPEEKA